MTESQFEAQADAAIAALERALEASALDVDLESKGSGVLELEFADGGKIVVNRHTAAREIWVAARSGGFHFRYDGAKWVDTRDATERSTNFHVGTDPKTAVGCLELAMVSLALAAVQE